MSDQAKKAAWIQAHQKTWGGFTGLPNRMVDHPAYAALSSAAAVRCVTWFWQEARYEQVKKKPGQDSLIGRVSDQIFYIGSGTRITIQVAGRLDLRMNDDPAGLQGNAGVLTVRITVYSNES